MHEVREVTRYFTSDGREWTHKDEAYKHQKKINLKSHIERFWEDELGREIEKFYRVDLAEASFRLYKELQKY